MSDGIGAIIMVGSGGISAQEQLVLHAQQASAQDLIVTLQRLGVAPIVVAAPTIEWLTPDHGLILDEDPPDEPFHFGQRLAGLIERHLPDSAVLYFGGGSAPLLDGTVGSMIVGLIDRAAGSDSSFIPSHIVLTNNLHSSDWVALSRTDAALPVIRQVSRDNSLAWLLRESGEYDVRVLSKMRPATSMDLDTPTDLALIAQHPDLSPALRQVIERHASDLSAIPIQAVIDLTRQEGRTIALFGRVSPQAWQAFNKVTRSWTRVIAEERGMVASGRIEAGQVRSMLTPWLTARGLRGFFEDIAGMADALIFDTRVLLAAQGIHPSAADRFASDLLKPEAVSDPWLREFTEIAATAPIPTILGGHSVVAGGLYALSEIIERGVKAD